MVVSKRCKVCAVIEPDNFPISGEYFGKSLPDLILKISGIDLDPRKSNGVLICKSCAVQLVHTDLLVDKLRNTLLRLKKLVKEAKPKTPSKDSSTVQSKTNTSTNNVELENSDKSETGETDSLTNLDESKSQDQIKPITPKKVVARRKSVFPDDKKVNNDDVAKENIKTAMTATSAKFKNVLDNSDKSETGEIDSPTNLDESKSEDQIKPKTPKKVVARRKSVFPDDKKVNNDDVAKENIKTPKSATSAESNKTLLDSDKATPIKKTPVKAVKRKVAPSTKNDLNKNIDNNQSDLAESTTVKRSKTKSISVTEDSPMDLTLDELFNDTNNETIVDGKVKVMNCSICGKVFHQKSALRLHIETNHMGERMKACPHCSTEFRSLQKYESHVFSEKCKNTNHPCQYPNCNKRFKTVHKMELHMHEKHSSQNESEED